MAAIQKAGGTVHYNGERLVVWDSTDENATWGERPWVPLWLVDLIGVDYFCHVNAVGFYSWSTATNEAIVPISRLTELEQLDLRRSRVSDAGLTFLKVLRKLSYLNVNHTQITDVGLAHLNGLTELTTLDLSDTEIADVGLDHLKGLTKLSELRLDSTHATDAGLVHLAAQTKLRYLDVSETAVTDSGLMHLKSKPKRESKSDQHGSTDGKIAPDRILAVFPILRYHAFSEKQQR